MRHVLVLGFCLVSSFAVAEQSGEMVCPWGQVFGEEQVKLDGNAEVNSYVPNATGFSDNATVRSNELVRLDGKARIGGDAISGGEVERHGPNTVITGSTTEDAALLDFCCLEDWIRHFADANNNAAIPNTSEGDDPYEDGKLTVQTGDTLTLQAGDYFFEEVNIHGTLLVSGAVRIFVDGTIQVPGTGKINPDGAPAMVQLFSADDGNNAVQIVGQGKVNALVYAMCGETHISGQGELCGAVATQELHVSGNGKIHYHIGSADICFFVEAEFLTDCDEEEEQNGNGPKD